MRKIAIHSVPRSGSTWLGSIFDSHPGVLYKFQPLFSYRFKSFLTSTSSEHKINKFFEELIRSEDDFIDQKESKANNFVPSFSKQAYEAVVYKEVRYHNILKNLLEKDTTIKVVGLVRNPLSVIASWFKAPKEFRKEQGWKIEEEWRLAEKKNLGRAEEYNGYDKWKEVTNMFEHFQNEYPQQFYLINYDDLLRDNVSVITNLFSFCGLSMHQQTLDFLAQSSSINQNDAYSVFKVKSKDDGWKQQLPELVIDEIVNDPYFKSLNIRYKWI